jgi:predicted phage terminase large subunit-like protein
MLISYNERLADAGSQEVRGYLLDLEHWPFDDVRIDPSSRALDKWNIAGTRGYFFCRGANAGIAGLGCSGIGVIDDPAPDVMTKDYNIELWRWWRQTVLARLQGAKGAALGARVIVCATRFSWDDLIGQILDSPDADKWSNLKLPMIAVEPDEDREVGDFLWPESEGGPPPPPEWDRAGPVWAGTFQQPPSVGEGGDFELKFLDSPFSEPARELRKRCEFLVIACDTSHGKKESANSDWTVFLVLGVIGREIYVLAEVRGKYHYSELKDMAYKLYESWKADDLVVEDTGFGTALLQDLRKEKRIKCNAALMTARSDNKGPALSKLARFGLVRGLLELDRVHWPASASWIDDHKNELLRFGAGAAHDDRPDTLTHALRRIQVYFKKQQNAGPFWRAARNEPREIPDDIFGIGFKPGVPSTQW